MAKLSGVMKLAAANFEGPKLSGANLQGANLSGVDLSMANLSGANLSEVIFSNETVWPHGFDPHQRDAVLKKPE